MNEEEKEMGMYSVRASEYVADHAITLLCQLLDDVAVANNRNLMVWKKTNTLCELQQAYSTQPPLLLTLLPLLEQQLYGCLMRMQQRVCTLKLTQHGFQSHAIYVASQVMIQLKGVLLLWDILCGPLPIMWHFTNPPLHCLPQ